MSLINDALKRASQVERNRSTQAPVPIALQPAPEASGSKMSLLLMGTVLLSLLLACWFFWQWWMVRHNLRLASTVNNTHQAVAIVTPPPAPLPKPLPVVAPAPVVTPAKPIPAPVATPPVAAAPRTVIPAAGQLPSNGYSQSPWPVDLKLTAIVFSKTNPRCIINGYSYGTSDNIHGIVIKQVQRTQVLLEWNGHTRMLELAGP